MARDDDYGVNFCGAHGIEFCPALQAKFAEETPAETFSGEAGEATPVSRVPPLVMDGAGYQSRLLVTNTSAAANRCELRLRGRGLNTYRFANAAGAARDGFVRAELDLPGPGDRIELTSFGRSPFLAHGHAALDCDGPVHARNLLRRVSTAEDTAGGLLGMTAISTVQPARAFRFPVVPRLGRLTLVLGNPAATEASCHATLETTVRDAPEAADHGAGTGARSPIPVPGESKNARNLDTLFELPADFAEGAVNLRCDEEIAAVSLLYAGGSFTALSPVVIVPTAAPAQAAR